MRSGLGRTILIWLLVAVVATVSLVFLVRPAVPAGAARRPSPEPRSPGRSPRTSEPGMIR